MKKILVIFIFFGIFSCANLETEYSYPADPDNARNARAGRFGKEIVIYGQKQNSAKK